MSSDINLIFPDNSIKSFPPKTTGYNVAESISISLAKKVLAYTINGKVYDLNDPIHDGKIELITRDDTKALELIRHSCAHVMAEAIQELWPETKLAIGPVIDNGFYYDCEKKEPFTPEDLPKIEKQMRKIIESNKCFRKEIWSHQKVKNFFYEKGEIYKLEILEMIPKNQDISIYFQNNWLDLCRGPHVASTGQIGTAFKLMKIAGAYWRGDSSRPMLTRIYGTAWASQKDLNEYLTFLSEAEKRDHRKIGREMDLFHFTEEGPGVIFWHNKGWKMFQTLMSYMRRRIHDDYEEISTPQILDKSLWEESGHWDWYKANMFSVHCADEKAEDLRSFALKPMNCPGHIKIFKYGIKSYRELPVRLAEFGSVHRYEPSGALHGLMRVRGFTQDDAHVFCTEEQMADECLKINDLIMSVYEDFGFKEITIKLSTRPEKYIGSDILWDRAENIMKDVLNIIEKSSKRQIKTGILAGEGAFYGPKFEYILRDAIGRDWQCGTIQVDFNLPERFKASYIDQHSHKCQPVMIHRAIFGSMERFLGILIENCSGNMPLWISPIQIIIATITSKENDYAQEVAHLLRKNHLYVETDLRNEKINYKIREHSTKKIPIIMICGNKEVEERSVNIRRFGSQQQIKLNLDTAIKELIIEATPPDLKRLSKID
ncbi:Threonyl-tRNA synthetase [Liberibacter crescens BT-1]|uniref:Threonine--tRNA ligase n=1 Tax=Liberibacter crescens (strain BT-1) TaxID=1215343 RepID=L0EVF3_LIBCB|nr:threonine--tRNA ligase [Liberibacter crescens]AGA64638.1 Threonyl-tRNA synthetase [Liberibacter crescens BT-1]AMC12751.1 threonine--tRNA ligase [Liberibacter crescens]